MSVGDGFMQLVTDTVRGTFSLAIPGSSNVGLRSDREIGLGANKSTASVISSLSD